MTDVPRATRLNRIKLILVAGIFLLPFLAAAIAVGVGWQPGTKSHGEAVLPQRSVQQVAVRMDDGSLWPWRDPEKPRLTLVALSTGACTRACVRQLTLLRNARITLNEKQDRLRLLYLGQLPAGRAGRILLQSWHHGRAAADALHAFRPVQAGQVAALLVEADGTALVRYPAGFSAEGVKDDLHKVLRR